MTEHLAVERKFRFIVRRADDEKNAPSFPRLGDFHLPAVIPRLFPLHVLHARQITTPSERNGDFPVVHPFFKSEIPRSVQIDPLRTRPVGPRVFRERNRLGTAGTGPARGRQFLKSCGRNGHSCRQCRDDPGGQLLDPSHVSSSQRFGVPPRSAHTAYTPDPRSPSSSAPSRAPEDGDERKESSRRQPLRKADDATGDRQF